jgi:hypothetical protein
MTRTKNTSELEEFLYDSCKQNSDLLAEVITNYVNSLSGDQLDELEDFLVNNFGED